MHAYIKMYVRFNAGMRVKCVLVDTLAQFEQMYTSISFR